jgi:hypothetical protein
MKSRCAKCGEPYDPAAELGRLAKGKPKRFTVAERERRREWMRKLRQRSDAGKASGDS